MLIAFSFFCCCLILLWFCIVVLLAVLFCLTLLLLVLPFSEIFAFVLFCFFNFDVISQPYVHKLFSVFLVLLSFVIIFLFCCYFTTLHAFSACQAEKKPTNRLLPFFLNLILHGQICLFCADKGIWLTKLGTKSVSY